MSLRVGFIGVGSIAHVHLKHIEQSDIGEIVAVCDVNVDAALQTAQKYGAASYTDYNQMMDRERLDALFVCVPPFAHDQIEENAASHDIHLFVEKPLGLCLEEAKHKAEILRKSGVLTSTGYCLRYLSVMREAKEFLRDRQIAMVNGYYLTQFVDTPWWRQMDKSGGQLVEQATHTVDMIRHLAGDISSVQAFMSLTVSGDIPNMDIADASSVNLLFHSGAVGQVSATCVQPDHRTGLAVMGKGFRLQITGSEMQILDGEEKQISRSVGDPYELQDRAFLEAIASGDPTGILAPYDEALKTLAVTLAANESARTGKVQKL